MYYSAEEWIDLFYKNNVIKLLNGGMTYKEISGLLKDRGYIVSPDAIRQALKRLGYSFDKNRDKWVSKEDKEFNDLINPLEIEEIIGGYAAKRYYSSYVEEELCCNEDEFINIPFHKDLLNEYLNIAEEMELENDMSYMYLVLLEHLDKVKPIDKTKEFNKQYYEEYGE